MLPDDEKTVKKENFRIAVKTSIKSLESVEHQNNRNDMEKQFEF